MSAERPGLASVNLGAARAIARRLVEEGRYESVSEAVRAGLRRLDEDARIVDRLAALGEEGLRSGVDASFDIDTFIDEVRRDTPNAQ